MNFDVSDTESRLIYAIADRACAIYDGLNRLKIEMDLTAVHANGATLRLEELLNAPRLDFCHDIAGIHDNIDRTTGKLLNCFSPRYSA